MYNTPDLSTFFESSPKGRLDVLYNAAPKTLLRDSLRIASAFAERATHHEEVLVLNSGVLADLFLEHLRRKVHQVGLRLAGYSLPMNDITQFADGLIDVMKERGVRVLILNSFEFAATHRSARFKLLETVLKACDQLSARVVVMSDQNPEKSGTYSGAMRMLMNIATLGVDSRSVVEQISIDRARRGAVPEEDLYEVVDGAVMLGAAEDYDLALVSGVQELEAGDGEDEDEEEDYDENEDYEEDEEVDEEAAYYAAKLRASSTPLDGPEAERPLFLTMPDLRDWVHDYPKPN